MAGRDENSALASAPKNAAKPRTARMAVTAMRIRAVLIDASGASPSDRSFGVIAIAIVVRVFIIGVLITESSILPGI